ncbi:MAG TPA: DUF2911 domain-containing protein [Gemmatimonadaceae bacterium]|nr:DUF2911 domain-containing protein [Gemmatimonadaceae bacterium]
MRTLLLLAAVGSVTLAPAPATAQARNGTLQAEPSGRVRTAITFRRGGTGQPFTVAVEYGQPHARGRAVLGGVVPYDRVWRTGANAATSLTTDLDLTIGGARVPRGRYTLYTLPTRAGWKLIINRQTGQWGTEYDPKQDLARVDLRTRTLREPAESFTIWLVPGGAGRGVLRMAWGTVELSTDWAAR